MNSQEMPQLINQLVSLRTINLQCISRSSFFDVISLRSEFQRVIMVNTRPRHDWKEYRNGRLITNFTIYLFITFGGNQANPNSANALNIRDASMKCLETDLFKKSSFRCRRENRRTRRKPAEASMDWKPNAHTAPGLGIEPGPIGA